MLPRCYFDQSKCAKLITNLKNYRKTWDDKLGQFTSVPVHNEHSHGADAFRTGAVVGRDNHKHVVLDDDEMPRRAVIAPQDHEDFDRHSPISTI